MARRLRAAGCGLTVLLACLVCGLSPHHAPGLVPTMLSFTPAAPADRDVVALPAGFAATVDRTTSDQCLRVVAGDVDRDGDIDVVGSLGSLDLIVWKNDGAGHFTRLPSGHHLLFQTQPPSPAVDGDSLASNEWIQNDQQRDTDLETLRARAAGDLESSLTPMVRVVTGRYGPRVRSSRAPPRS